jgi:hypothetical protein
MERSLEFGTSDLWPLKFRVRQTRASHSSMIGAGCRRIDIEHRCGSQDLNMHLSLWLELTQRKRQSVGPHQDPYIP